MLAVCCLLFDVVVCYLLFSCFMFVVRCRLPSAVVVCCVMLIVLCCGLSVVCCRLLVVCCLCLLWCLLCIVLFEFTVCCLPGVG